MGKKYINKKWLDKIDLLGIAYLYQDDGSLTLRKNSNKLSNLTFHVNSFSEEEQELIIQKLLSYGLQTRRVLSANSFMGKTKGEDQYVLMCTREQMVKDFLKKIYQYHTTCMSYKFRLITGE